MILKPLEDRELVERKPHVPSLVLDRAGVIGLRPRTTPSRGSWATFLPDQADGAQSCERSHRGDSDVARLGIRNCLGKRAGVMGYDGAEFLTP